MIYFQTKFGAPSIFNKKNVSFFLESYTMGVVKNTFLLKCAFSPIVFILTQCTAKIVSVINCLLFLLSCGSFFALFKISPAGLSELFTRLQV